MAAKCAAKVAPSKRRKQRLRASRWNRLSAKVRVRLDHASRQQLRCRKMNDATTTTDVKTDAGVEQFKVRPVAGNGRKGESSVATEPVGPPKTIFREYFESAAVTVIMALFGMTFIVQAVKVP